MSLDGKVMAATDQDGTVEVVDVQSRTPKKATLRGNSPATPVSLKPGWYATPRRIRGAVTVWNVATKRRTGADIAPGGNYVYAVWDPADASRLFTVGDDGTIEPWVRHDPDHPQRIWACTMRRRPRIYR